MHGRSRSRDRSRGHAAAMSPFAWSAELARATVGLTVPSGTGYTRAACYSSVQLGSTSILDMSAFAALADVLYTGRASDAWEYGLVLEEARTNLVLARDTAAASWSRFGGIVRTGSQASPVGDNAAARFEAPSGGGLGENVAGATASAFTTSAWVRSHSGTAAPNFNTFRTLAGRVAINTAVGTTWTRLSQSLSGGGGETSALLPVDGRDWSGVGGVAAGTRDIYVDCPQRELGSFPTEWIPTAGSARTRAANFFRILSATLAPTLALGQLRLEMHLRPKGARTEYSTAAVALWWIDANNHASLAPSTGTLTIAVGGVTNTCALPSWARHDELRLFFEVGGSQATRVRYSVNGAAPVAPAITGSALGAVSAGDVYLCSTSTTNHLSCWLYAARLWRAGRAPSWVGA